MATYARILAGLYGLVITLIIVTAYLTIKYAGFPDGHLTDYEKAVKTPLILCNVVNATVAIILFRQCFNKYANLMKVCITIVAHVIFLLVYTYGLDWYLKVHLALDYGQGG
jgi:hypothetical protein